MTIRSLADPDWAIEHLNSIERIVTRLKEWRSQGLALSVVSLAERYEGSHDSRDPDQRQQACDAFLKMSLCWASTKRCAGSSGENVSICEKPGTSSATLTC
jgi:hypothetical protein